MYLVFSPFTSRPISLLATTKASVFVFVACIILSLAQQPNWGLGRLIFEVSRWHKIRQTQRVALLWTSDQPVAEVATYTTNNKHITWNSVTSPGFEPAIPAIKWLQSYVLYRTPVRHHQLTPDADMCRWIYIVVVCLDLHILPHCIAIFCQALDECRI
jgi:hypothetical protein